MKINSLNDWKSLLLHAENGDSKSQNEVACHYRDGLVIDNIEIVKEDKQEAFNWTKRAYENGDVDAMHEYADYLSDRESKVCEMNIELAMELYEKCISLGSSSATYNLGLEYRNKQNFEKAFQLYVKSEQTEECYKNLTVGLCYYFGVGINKDRLKSLEIFKSIKSPFCSEYEVDEANYMIGKIFLDGEVVEQSFDKARYYLELADKDGDHRSAQEILYIIGRTKLIE
jgi:TPR repeat protein